MHSSAKKSWGDWMQALLIDLEGVIHEGNNPVKGVRECLDFLDDHGYDYKVYLQLHWPMQKDQRLGNLGFNVPIDHIFTPPIAALDKMKRTGKRRCFLLTMGDVNKDFQDAGITIAGTDVNFVIVGDAGEKFSFENMTRAFRLILNGAEILALEMDKYWADSSGLVLSAGPFVAALEYATDKDAELMGKPAPSFFELVLRELGVKPEEAAMIGDDILTDIGGAQRVGMKGILVKTDKFREEVVKHSGVIPDLVLESIARLTKYL